MKNQNEITKEATRLAYNYLTSFNNIRFGRSPKLDMRYNVNKLAVQIMREKRSTINKDEIQAKRKIRSTAHFNFTNILSNPIVKDFISNKNNIVFINEERMNFGHRNHWAKNEQDKKILSILNKHI